MENQTKLHLTQALQKRKKTT